MSKILKFSFLKLNQIAGRVVRKIESSRRDGRSNRGDCLFFVFLMLVKLSYAHSEKPAHLTE